MSNPFKGKGLRKENFNLETKYIIDDFLVEESITLIYASPKQGKSRFAIGLAKYLFSKTNYYTQYFDFDNPLSALGERGIDRVVDEGIGRFDYIHPEKVTITSQEALNNLVSAANVSTKNFKKEVFFIDSATDFVDETNDNAVKIFMNKLKTLRNAGATIIVLHHSNKTDKNYKGSSVFKSAADNVYFLKNEFSTSDETMFLLDLEAGRFKVRNSAFGLSSNYVLSLLDYEDVCIPATEQLVIQKIKKVLSKQKEGLNQTKILEELDVSARDKTTISILHRYVGKFWDSFDGKQNSKIYKIK